MSWSVTVVQTSFPTVLRVGAAVWFLAFGITADFMYLLNGKYGVSAWLWKVSLALALGMGAILLLTSMFRKTASHSVLAGSFISGAMLFPVVVVFGAIGLSYIAAAPEKSRPWLWFVVGGTTVLWCLRALVGYKQRMIERRFIEREFSIEETRITVRQPTKTDLDPPPIGEHTLIGKLYHGLGPYLIFAIPLAYPLQRLLTDTAGGAATLLLLAMLGCPLTIYLLGRLTCGAYLWVYKVWQLERLHGKPVVFDLPMDNLQGR